MNDSIVILGRQPALGLAELESLYGPSYVAPIGSHAARLSIPPCAVDFARLGGTVKLAKLLTIIDTNHWHKIEEFLLNVAPEHAAKMPAGKLHLGLSAYDIAITSSQLLATGIKLKRAIHDTTGRSVHFIPNKTIELNAAQVLHNQLTGDHGWELLFIADHHKTIIAQTVSVQDIANYSLRDYSRPKRDAQTGMLPPKLAQIILNLANGPQEGTTIDSSLPSDNCLSDAESRKLREARSRITVLDPFCGTGVILQEALLTGYRAYGTDIDGRMIKYTQANLTWLSDRYRLKGSRQTLEIGDATTYHWQPPIDAVATECYLGRPFTTQPPIDVLEQTKRDCNLIITKFLKQIHPQLKTDTRLCLGIPAWQTKPGIFLRLPLIDQLSDLGYNRVSFKHARNGELIYFRAEQIVARQLLVITRK